MSIQSTSRTKEEGVGDLFPQRSGRKRLSCKQSQGFHCCIGEWLHGKLAMEFESEVQFPLQMNDFSLVVSPTFVNVLQPVPSVPQSKCWPSHPQVTFTCYPLPVDHGPSGVVVPGEFNSIQFSFIYIAPNYNKCHLKALNVTALSTQDTDAGSS